MALENNPSGDLKLNESPELGPEPCMVIDAWCIGVMASLKKKVLYA